MAKQINFSVDWKVKGTDPILYARKLKRGRGFWNGMRKMAPVLNKSLKQDLKHKSRNSPWFNQGKLANSFTVKAKKVTSEVYTLEVKSSQPYAEVVNNSRRISGSPLLAQPFTQAADNIGTPSRGGPYIFIPSKRAKWVGFLATRTGNNFTLHWGLRRNTHVQGRNLGNTKGYMQLAWKRLGKRSDIIILKEVTKDLAKQTKVGPGKGVQKKGAKA